MRKAECCQRNDFGEIASITEYATSSEVEISIITLSINFRLPEVSTRFFDT